VKQILLIVIKLYWYLIPKRNRRPCLFKETCSKFVYTQTKELGFLEGIKSLLLRYKKCQKGYQIHISDQGFFLELIDGSIIFEKDISPNILNSINSLLKIKTGELSQDNDS
jgi:hypothetical protein